MLTTYEKVIADRCLAVAMLHHSLEQATARGNREKQVALLKRIRFEIEALKRLASIDPASSPSPGKPEGFLKKVSSKIFGKAEPV